MSIDTDDIRARVRAAWDAADAETRSAGALWYSQARESALDAASRGDYPSRVGDYPIRACAMAAVLSPRLSWRVNLRAVYHVCAGKSRLGLGRAWAAAERILRGEDPSGVVRGPKVEAFWHALCGDPDAVVLDVHMYRLAGHPRVTDRRLRAPLEAAIRSVAAEAGVAPAVFQATTWIQVRGRAD